MKRLLVMCALVAAATYLGCKQQEGDRCQVNADCDTGVCNKAKGTCASSGETGEIDAAVPILIDGAADATVPDDAPADAAPDATSDGGE